MCLCQLLGGCQLSCLVPRSWNGVQVVDFEVRTGTTRLVSDALKFEYYEAARYPWISFAIAWDNARGTRVGLNVCRVKLEGPLSCSFGIDKIVEARIMSDGIVECVSPRLGKRGQRHCIVTWRYPNLVTWDGTYVCSPGKHTIHPRQASTTGKDLRVLVCGQNFVRAQELACRFGSMMRPAEYV